MDISQVRLTNRQKQVWEMTHGLGEYEQPMKAQEISKMLGISTNAVYVTRRRVKQLLEREGIETGELRPKRIVRHASGKEAAVLALRRQLEEFDREENALRERLEQIENERPEITIALRHLDGAREPEKAAA